MGRSRGLFLTAAFLAAVALVARRRLDVVEIRGGSMRPTLMPSDRLLVGALPPRAGDIVLAPDPREPQRELVKRVAGIDDGGVTLRGDDPTASTDGRTFGAVPREDVRWRVLARYWPPGRIGLVPGAEEGPGSAVGEVRCGRRR